MALSVNLERKFWLLLTTVLLLLISLPLLNIFFQVRTEFFTNFVSLITSKYCVNTVLLMLLTCVFALIFGVIPAWFVARFDFPFRKILSWMLIIPMAFPAYIMAYTYKGLLGLYGTWHAAFGQYFEIESIAFLSFLMALCLYPYVYLGARLSFLFNIDKYYKAALTMGSSPTKAFLKVALPMSWPAIIGGLLLVAMEVLNNYGAVQYFGIRTFTTEIIRWWNPMDYSPVRNISGILILFVVIIYWLDRKFRGRSSFAGRNQKSHVRHLKLKGIHKWAALLICFIPVFLGFVVPFVQLFAWAWTKFEVLFQPEVFRSIYQTFGLAFVTALLLTFMAFVIRFVIRHSVGIKWISSLSKLAVTGYAVPGALLGVGLLVLTGFVGNQLGMSFTASIPVLIFAYIIRFYGVANNTIDGGFERLNINYGWASFNLGKSYSSTMKKVHAPLLSRTMLACFVLVFVDVMKELPLTMMFQTFNFKTLAVKTFMLMETDGAVYDASMPALLIVMISILPAYFANKLLAS